VKRKETLVAEVHGKENKNFAGDKKWGVPDSRHIRQRTEVGEGCGASGLRRNI
jgi:hypothetical protein